MACVRWHHMSGRGHSSVKQVSQSFDRLIGSPRTLCCECATQELHVSCQRWQ